MSKTSAVELKRGNQVFCLNAQYFPSEGQYFHYLLWVWWVFISVYKVYHHWDTLCATLHRLLSLPTCVMERSAGVSSGRRSWSSRKCSIVYLPSGMWHVWSGTSSHRLYLWFFVLLRYFMSASRIYNNIHSFALLGRDTYFYHSLYDVCFLNYWCFAIKKNLRGRWKSLEFRHRGEVLE